MNTWPIEVFTGYLAGFMDGEGCIEIHKSGWGLRIRIANTFKPTLDAIHDRLGIGRVIEYRGRTSKGHQRLFCYEVSNAHDVRTLLLMVRPYLKVKAERADEAMAVIARLQREMDERDARNREIMAAIAAGEMQKSIAKRFGLSVQTISRLKGGHTWPTEIARLNGRIAKNKWFKPCDQVFRLHGRPATERCSDVQSAPEST